VYTEIRVREGDLDILVWSGQTSFRQETKMYITNISEAKAHLSALIEKVQAGEEVIIGKAGKPIAKLVRYERDEEPRRPGALEGKIKIADDFDELPSDVAEAFGISEP
jgi:prevent-host-death family protein